MKRKISIALVLIISVSFFAYGEYQKTNAIELGFVDTKVLPPIIGKSKFDDPMFCIEGWVFIQYDCDSEHPNWGCSYCNSTNRTIACFPPIPTLCDCITNCEPLPDGLK